MFDALAERFESTWKKRGAIFDENVEKIKRD
ncbi:hypothetical protein PA905_13810 [Planktothrix agardhii CCAP 1459/11A]|jgi:hypothetical protein|uniref:Uncharacterized protein n=1 Tax=Planktothrix agardhii CCAP 1459/11A TaxID=282420 RepID=A0A4P5ZJP5_PLAAG|nr:hypothetical protein PA905_13810 [Planktothrix agardhii CCAP 1459/11A]CAD5918811.1 hypothetical protein PCC7821_00524 [Planktothrix rubescens NIVA-CYA 18]CAD5947644.1 hypothetical protein NO108_02713 [Planktothrix rubescens]CAH2571088.1 hypothetical protein PRNO82_00479 [Planktothrix rubescens]